MCRESKINFETGDFKNHFKWTNHQFNCAPYHLSLHHNLKFYLIQPKSVQFVYSFIILEKDTYWKKNVRKCLAKLFKSNYEIFSINNLSFSLSNFFSASTFRVSEKCFFFLMITISFHSLTELLIFSLLCYSLFSYTLRKQICFGFLPH